MDTTTIAAIEDAVRLAAPARVFAWFVVEREGRRRTLLLADRTEGRGGVALVRWDHAPLAEAFFAGELGQPYAIETDERTLEGTLLARARVEHAGPELSAVITDSARWTRLAKTWVHEPRARPEVLRGRPAVAGSRGIVDVELDARQAAAVAHDDSLLILGEAGFGKTTVALHRVKRLARARNLVLVPTPALAAVCRRGLDRLGASAEVTTVDAWLLREARKAFAGLPRRASHHANAAVIRTKRHPAIEGLLDDVLAEVATEQKTTRIGRAHLLALFGDRPRLLALGLGERTISEVLEHTHAQFEETTEQAFAHVDRDRLESLDGRSLDDGTPTEHADTIDFEDAPVLFALARAQKAKVRRTTYDHIVVDEAQELAPMELTAIAGALSRGGVLTVAGDAHQQLDDTAYFTGWPATRAALGLVDAETIELEESYRCPAPVLAYARSGAPSEEVVKSTFADPVEQIVEVGAVLQGWMDADPGASIAVIAPTVATAEQLAERLSKAIAVTFTPDGAAVAERGIVVTVAEALKGLEVDDVVLVVPPKSDRHRYVAATRARRRVWLVNLQSMRSPERTANSGSGDAAPSSAVDPS